MVISMPAFTRQRLSSYQTKPQSLFLISSHTNLNESERDSTDVYAR